MDQAFVQLLDDYAKTHNWADDSARREFAQVCLRRFERDHRFIPKPALMALAAYASLMEEYERSKRVATNPVPRDIEEQRAYTEVTNWLLSRVTALYPDNLLKRISIFTYYSGALDVSLARYDHFRRAEPPVVVSVDM